MLLGDPFHFLADWPPFAFIRRHCPFYSPVSRMMRGDVLRGFIRAESTVLFYTCLPNKTFTVFPYRKVNQISSSASSEQVFFLFYLQIYCFIDYRLNCRGRCVDVTRISGWTSTFYTLPSFERGRRRNSASKTTPTANCWPKWRNCRQQCGYFKAKTPNSCNSYNATSLKSSVICSGL